MRVIIPKISKISPTGLPNISCITYAKSFEGHSSSIIPSREPSDISVNTEQPLTGKPVKASYISSYSQVYDIAYDVFCGAFVNVGPN